MVASGYYTLEEDVRHIIHDLVESFSAHQVVDACAYLAKGLNIERRIKAFFIASFQNWNRIAFISILDGWDSWRAVDQ